MPSVHKGEGAKSKKAQMLVQTIKQPSVVEGCSW